MSLGVRFEDDGHSVNVCRRFVERKYLKRVFAFAVVVAAVGIDGGRVAAVDGRAIVISI